MQGAGEKLRWALAGVGTVYGVISSLVPEASLGHYGPGVAIVVLGGVVVWLEVDKHAGVPVPVPEAHKAELKRLAVAMASGGTGAPLTPASALEVQLRWARDMRGLNLPRDREIFWAHFPAAHKAFTRWEKVEGQLDAARAEVTRRGKVEERQLALGGDGILAELLSALGWALSTGAPASWSKPQWKWDIRDDGSVHRVVDGGDRIIASHGGAGSAALVDEALTGVGTWNEVNRAKRVWTRYAASRERFWDEVTVAAQTHVVRGSCRYC
jgi:hypothetical protein